MIPDMRKLFCPVQPAITKISGNISYREYTPCAGLMPYIYCYWELKATGTLITPFTYNVVADGCIDIFFDLDNPAESFVMGFCDRHNHFLIQGRFNYIGIRFFPSIFPQIFPSDASELKNNCENLNLIARSASEFIRDTFSPALNISQIKAMLDSFFLKMIHISPFKCDNRFYEALTTILIKSGKLNVEKDIDTGISLRQLRRQFDIYLGGGPKIFSSVVRFQNILLRTSTIQSLDTSSLFFNSGYYDQSHFIKEFNRFYGTSPGRSLIK